MIALAIIVASICGAFVASLWFAAWAIQKNYRTKIERFASDKDRRYADALMSQARRLEVAALDKLKHSRYKESDYYRKGASTLVKQAKALMKLKEDEET